MIYKSILQEQDKVLLAYSMVAEWWGQTWPVQVYILYGDPVFPPSVNPEPIILPQGFKPDNCFSVQI